MPATKYAPVVDVALVAKFDASDVKGKNVIKAEIKAAFKTAFLAGEYDRAADLNATEDVVLTKVVPTKPETDYVTVVAQRVLDLRNAADLLEAGLATPKGVEQVSVSELSYKVNLSGLVPSDEASVIANAKITRSDLRHSIQAVFDRAFDGLESGDFLTSTEIASKGSIEGYEAGTGAVCARMVPRNGSECTLTGVTVTPATATAPLGATKV